MRRLALAAALLLASPALAQPASTPPLQLVEISFGYVVPTPEFRARMDAAASLLANVPGLHWKVWAINEGEQRASGVYLFRDATAAERYLSEVFGPHMGTNPAVADVAVRRYGVMEDATRITRGKLD